MQHPDIRKKEVLDHGFVHLIDFMGEDTSVIRAARTSYDAEWRAGEDEGSDAKLINYLWKHRHTTPFEAAIFAFEVKAPIFVFRQWHHTFGYKELSVRYEKLPEEFYLPQIEQIGTQSTSSKSARDTQEFGDMNTLDLRTKQIAQAKAMMEASFAQYRQLLADGWPQELARSVLPVAAYSHMLCTVSLLNLMEFFSLRSHEHGEYEMRVYSDTMKELIRPIVPVCLEACEKSNQSNR